MRARIDLIANNGTVGGGEVMMVALADAARAVGVPTRIVAPRSPAGAADLARARGFDVLEVPARDRRSYLVNLIARRHELDGELWWCNGLVPALAAVGSRHRRVVQLHQAPVGSQRPIWEVARRGVEAVFVPSRSMCAQVHGAHALLNWTDDLAPMPIVRPPGCDVVRVGFIGRFSPIKGLDVLAAAIRRIQRVGRTPVQLVLAGDDRFVPAPDVARVESALAGVASVVRLGWVPRETFFAAVDLVVAPSVWAEPFGLVAAEAMAVGRPIVVSDAGALPEVVGPRHPWIARAGDVADTARVMTTVIGASPDELEDWRRAARTRWEAEFSPRAGGERVRRVLEDLGVRPASAGREP